MANPRINDTSLWLHNKLGTSNDLWSGSSICSQLNREVLRNIRDCFNNLQSQVKLKLLLAFLHIPRRNVEEWRIELEEIQEIALEDSDQWVSMVAELLKKFPHDGSINFDIQENATVFTDLVSELKKLVKKHADKNILPLECLYLNKSAFSSQLGHVSQPAKHFTLKRKPKSAALRAELLQRSTDAATSVRRNSTSSTVPIRCRGVSKDLDAPIRPIPRLSQPFKQPPNSVNRNRGVLTRPTPGSKRDVGIKLLDITEQPIGREVKRKKKTDDDKDKSKEDKLPAEAEQTPDYAAGLSMIPPSPAPAYSLPASSSHEAAVSSKAPDNLATPMEVASHEESMVVEQQVQTQQQPQSVIRQQQQASTGPIAAPVQQQQFIIQQQPPVQQLLITQQPHQAQPGEKKTLSLSREQMAEAQEMFKSSNKVTRPEKALILGFMAGSRENPCPQLGNIVTIKLSENHESMLKQDGTSENVFVETHYQMNYGTGEGKRIKKYPKLDSSMLGSQPMHAAQTSQQKV